MKRHISLISAIVAPVLAVIAMVIVVQTTADKRSSDRSKGRSHDSEQVDYSDYSPLGKYTYSYGLLFGEKKSKSRKSDSAGSSASADEAREDYSDYGPLGVYSQSYIKIFGRKKGDSNAKTGISPRKKAEPEEAREEKRTDIGNLMGFYNGINKLSGHMLHSATDKWPFTLEFKYDYNTDEITDVVYVNMTSKTKMDLRVKEYDGRTLSLEGYDGQKEFSIRFTGSNPYTGDSWWGDHHESIELSLR